MNNSLDLSFIAIILAIGAISISVIFATSRNLAASQLVFWILGLSVLYLAAHFTYYNLKAIALPLYLISLVALLAVFFLGESVRGSVRWINLEVFRLQPSEIAKVAIILSLAIFFIKKSAQDIKNIILSLLLILPIFVLIFTQPDIGSSMAILAIWASIILAAGIKLRQILIIIFIFLTAAIFTYEILAPYQKERISTFINPQRDPLGAGYNIIQSKIAVGSGQIFGRGLGRGSQSQLNFLPEAESDFIFASTAEQLGFVGAGFLIILYVYMLTRIQNIAREADRFGQLTVMGTLGLLIYQFTVSIGMNMGLIPITGITLPLVSYGGSSLISTLLLLGIIFSIKHHQY